MFGRHKGELIGSATVSFYQGMKGGVVELWEGTGGPGMQMLLACSYLAKCLFNYGQNPFAHDLVTFAKAAAFEVLGQDGANVTRPSVTGEWTLYPSAPAAPLVEKQEIQLLQRADGQSYPTTTGTSDLHLPFAANVLLFQDLINTLPEDNLRVFAITVLGMTEYYETNSWTNPRSVIDAPNYGWQKVGELFGTSE